MENNSGQRILVADDEEFIREIISRFLTASGFSCVTATDGREALLCLSDRSFNLALLDYKMPGITGEEVLREITMKYPDTAAIMVTATSDIDTVIHLMKMGASDFIVKPIDLQVLLLSVNRALEKQRLLVENRSYQLYLEEKIEEQTEKIRASLLNSITSLAFALEAKDDYTSGHSQRVAGISKAIAQELGLPLETRDRIGFAGLVHDIGKIGTKEDVLNKGSQLTDEEYYHITFHSIVGERILTPVVDGPDIPLMVRHHHERFDGLGYPDRLIGDLIPIGARILCVADTYDAMTSDRPYRSALSHEVTMRELENKAGTQFDPMIVSAFSNLMETDLQRVYRENPLANLVTARR